ncbi:MAG: hypothetical protein ACOC33_02080 [bacterium]
MKSWELKHKILEKREKYSKMVDCNYSELQEYTDEIINTEVSEVVSALVEMTNTSCCRNDVLAKAIFDGISKQHRYLQGEFWLVFAKVIQMYSETEWVDPRNKFAKDICKDFVKGTVYERNS